MYLNKCICNIIKRKYCSILRFSKSKSYVSHWLVWLTQEKPSQRLRAIKAKCSASYAFLQRFTHTVIIEAWSWFIEETKCQESSNLCRTISFPARKTWWWTLEKLLGFSSKTLINLMLLPLCGLWPFFTWFVKHTFESCLKQKKINLACENNWKESWSHTHFSRRSNTIFEMFANCVQLALMIMSY